MNLKYVIIRGKLFVWMLLLSSHRRKRSYLVYKQESIKKADKWVDGEEACSYCGMITTQSETVPRITGFNGRMFSSSSAIDKNTKMDYIYHGDQLTVLN